MTEYRNCGKRQKTEKNICTPACWCWDSFQVVRLNFLAFCCCSRLVCLSCKSQVIAASLCWCARQLSVCRMRQRLLLLPVSLIPDQVLCHKGKTSLSSSKDQALRHFPILSIISGTTGSILCSTPVFQISAAQNLVSVQWALEPQESVSHRLYIIGSLCSRGLCFAYSACVNRKLWKGAQIFSERIVYITCDLT